MNDDALTPGQVKAWRQRLGWTQAEACAELGKSERAYRGYEKGATLPASTVKLMREIWRRRRIFQWPPAPQD